MSKPFTLTLVEGVTAPLRKPGWHRRSLAADRAAAARRTTVAPQHGDKRADAKAVEYARWIAARNGIVLPVGASVIWDCCHAGMRPRSVAFGSGSAAVSIDLPHWDYAAPEVVATELLEWAPPVVREVEPAEVGAPGATESEKPADLTTGALTKTVSEYARRDASDVPKVAVHFEAMAICPAVGMPCKVDCPHRRGCGPVRPVAAVRATSLPVIASRALAARLSASAAYHARRL